MVLRKIGNSNFGDVPADVRAYLGTYSAKNGYPADHFADAGCRCGSKVFSLQVDEKQGVAIRKCQKCRARHPMGDSAEYLMGASLEECECPCGKGFFEISAGVSLYEDSEDVKWMYLGCRCVACGQVGCYGDWKNEFEGYKKLLAMI